MKFLILGGQFSEKRGFVLKISQVTPRYKGGDNRGAGHPLAKKSTIGTYKNTNLGSKHGRWSKGSSRTKKYMFLDSSPV